MQGTIFGRFFNKEKYPVLQSIKNLIVKKHLILELNSCSRSHLEIRHLIRH